MHYIENNIPQDTFYTAIKGELSRIICLTLSLRDFILYLSRKSY